MNALVAPPRPLHHHLLQRPLRVRRPALGRAAKLHAAADVVAPLGAELARAARQADLERDAVARGERRDLGPDGLHDAGGLVAERQRLEHEDVAVAEVVVVVQVGAAEAGGGDLDEDGGGGEGGDRAGFLWRLLEAGGEGGGDGGRTMRRSRAPWRTEAWIVEAMVFGWWEVGGWVTGVCKREVGLSRSVVHREDVG